MSSKVTSIDAGSTASREIMFSLLIGFHVGALRAARVSAPL